MAPSYKMFLTRLNFSLEIQLNIKTLNNHHFLWSPFSKHAILHPLFRMRQIHYFLIQWIQTYFISLTTYCVHSSICLQWALRKSYSICSSCLKQNYQIFFLKVQFWKGFKLLIYLILQATEDNFVDYEANPAACRLHQKKSTNYLSRHMALHARNWRWSLWLNGNSLQQYYHM